MPGHEHKAFIPFTGLFKGQPQHKILRAKVLEVLSPHRLRLDRIYEGQTELDFDYLVAATGRKLQEPGTLPHEDKLNGIKSVPLRVGQKSCGSREQHYSYFKMYQKKVKDAPSIAVLGAGAVGVRPCLLCSARLVQSLTVLLVSEMALDIKEYYPDKDVTLVHSRDFTMSTFDRRLHDDHVAPRCRELGVRLLLNKRVKVPPEGYRNNGDLETVTFEDGDAIQTHFAVCQIS